MDRSNKDLIKACFKKSMQRLISAKKLLELKKYDDSVSRAYYAVFYATQAVLLSKDLASKSHHGLIQLFGLHFIKTNELSRDLGIILSELKDDREKGDYEIYSTLDRVDAQEALKKARIFVSEIRKYLSIK